MSRKKILKKKVKENNYDYISLMLLTRNILT